ncbi:MAG: hypothetical protein ACSHYA_06830 [Opitutaceae bacterium]
MRSLIRLKILTVLCSVVLLIAGCDAPEVSFVVDRAYGDATVQVDFVKVERTDLATWLAKDVDEYFSPGDKMRERAAGSGGIYSVYINVPDRRFVDKIGPKDPLWNRFAFESGKSEQSFDILILADLPGDFSAGGKDIRRQVIPLYRKAWSTSMIDVLLRRGLDTLEISISPSGIGLDPAPIAGSL